MQKLSELQIEEYELLQEFIRICKTLDLRYYMVAGSMLGTYRHQGFIPWDDDIDVAMPRKDYDIFVSKAMTIVNDKFLISTPLDNGHYILTAQMVSKKKKYILNNARNKVITGAWIDIMAIDGVPDPGIRRLLHWSEYMILRTIFQLSHFSDVVNLNRERPFYERIVIRFASVTHIEKILNSIAIARTIEKHLRKVDYEHSNYVATYCGVYRNKEIFPRATYGFGKEYQFEDISVMGVSNPTEYLSQLYGDFMTPPSDARQRNRHNVTKYNNE